MRDVENLVDHPWQSFNHRQALRVLFFLGLPCLRLSPRILPIRKLVVYWLHFYVLLFKLLSFGRFKSSPTTTTRSHCTERRMDSLDCGTLRHIMSYLDHGSVAVCRFVSSKFRVVPRCDGRCRFRHAVGTPLRDDLVGHTAASVAAGLPLDAALCDLPLPQEMKALVAAYRLLWLSQQPDTYLIQQATVDAAITIGINNADQKCLSDIWNDALHVVPHTLAHP